MSFTSNLICHGLIEKYYSLAVFYCYLLLLILNLIINFKKLFYDTSSNSINQVILG